MALTLITAPAEGAEGAVKAPAWVLDLLGPRPSVGRRDSGNVSLWVFQGKDRALISASVPSVLSLSRGAFEEATFQAYEAIRRELQELAACHPLRLWNFIPGLLSPLGDLPHRYMAFNAGRFRSYGGWFESKPDFTKFVPTATGVGHDGEELLIHCLSCTHPGTAVENPRQISSYCYSRRFGPLPPCFARATRIESRGRPGTPDWLLVGGTASVLGEESLHLQDPGAQARETFDNLAAVASAGDRGGIPAPGERQLHWDRYRHLRVYYVRPVDLPLLTEAVRKTFRGLETVEFRRADLCRPELLVEIEGVVELELPLGDALAKGGTPSGDNGATGPPPEGG